MKKEIALRYLVSKVAYANYQSVKLAKKVPALKENTQNILEKTVNCPQFNNFGLPTSSRPPSFVRLQIKYYLKKCLIHLDKITKLC